MVDLRGGANMEDRVEQRANSRGVAFTFDSPEEEERFERMHGKRLDRLARNSHARNSSSGIVIHPNVPGCGPQRTFAEFAENFCNYGCNRGPPPPRPRPLNVPQDPPLPYMLESHAEDLRRQAKSEENRQKYMMLLALTENFYAGEWKISDMAPICGGVQPANINHNALNAAEYAIPFLNKQQDEYDEIKLKQLIRANWQFMRCKIYWLTMEATDQKFYEALVLVSEDEYERVLKFIRPAKFYPEIPSHLHHLIGPPRGEQ